MKAGGDWSCERSLAAYLVFLLARALTAAIVLLLAVTLEQLSDLRRSPLLICPFAAVFAEAQLVTAG